MPGVAELCFCDTFSRQHRTFFANMMLLFWVCTAAAVSLLFLKTTVVCCGRVFGPGEVEENTISKIR
jgi:hypothetical protein